MHTQTQTCVCVYIYISVIKITINIVESEKWGRGIGLMGELKYQLSIKTSIRAAERWSRSNVIPFLHPDREYSGLSRNGDANSSE